MKLPYVGRFAPQDGDQTVHFRMQIKLAGRRIPRQTRRFLTKSLTVRVDSTEEGVALARVRLDRFSRKHYDLRSRAWLSPRVLAGCRKFPIAQYAREAVRRAWLAGDRRRRRPEGALRPDRQGRRGIEEMSHHGRAGVGGRAAPADMRRLPGRGHRGPPTGQGGAQNPAHVMDIRHSA